MSGLEDEFSGKVVAQNVDAKTPDAVTAVQELGFKNHGLVIRTSEGRVLWSQPDHEVEPEQVRLALKKLLRAR